MIKKVVNKYSLQDSLQTERDLAYWLSRPLEERVSAVEILRRQHHGSSVRLQRVARIVKRSQG